MPLLGAVTGGAPPTKVKVPDLTPTACSKEGTLWGGEEALAKGHARCAATVVALDLA